MSFVNRGYPDVVRDGLTTLTDGVTGEVVKVTYDPTARPVRVPDIVLRRRPVRRVSYVAGQIENRDGERVPYTFSMNDYELVPDPTAPENLYAIRFLPFGKRPAPDSDLVINYYPRTSSASRVTDLNVGSVVRTLVEVVGRELAMLYGQLNLAYDSAFLETAKDVSLERVVALLGYRRFQAGRPAGIVRFGRRAGSVGTITIPAGTPVTDTEDKIRYETIDTHTMLPGESTAEVRVRGATDSTPPVLEKKLTVVQQVIAGIDSVLNEQPTTRATEDETDDELRARVRVALEAANKGTVGAIRQGLLQLPGVRDVAVIEMPNGVPGEIQLQVGLEVPSDTLPDNVLQRIEELRPAGVRVVGMPAKNEAIGVQIGLTLAGSRRSPAEIESMHAAIRQALAKQIGRTGVGRPVRAGALVAAILSDAKIVDASVSIAKKGAAAGIAGADYVPADNAAVVITEDDISFAADAYDEKPPAGGQNVPVEVRAVVAVQLLTGVSIDAAKTQVTTRLGAYFTRLTAGTSVDTPSVLGALRDDAKYAVDPGRLTVSLTAEDQFVQILQGGPGFQVRPGHQFTVASVEVTA